MYQSVGGDGEKKVIKGGGYHGESKRENEYVGWGGA
jgi:hypothetical protein